MTHARPSPLPRFVSSAAFFVLARDVFAALGDPIEIPLAAIRRTRTDHEPPRGARERYRLEERFTDGRRTAWVAREEDWSGEGLAEVGGAYVEGRIEGLPGGAALQLGPDGFDLQTYALEGPEDAARALEAALLAAVRRLPGNAR